MEKQLILRSLGPNLPFLMVSAGSIKDGQFIPESDVLQVILYLGGIDTSLIEYPSIFNGEAVISRSNLLCFFGDVFHTCLLKNFEYYDNFMVFKFDIDEVEKETSEKE